MFGRRQEDSVTPPVAPAPAIATLPALMDHGFEHNTHAPETFSLESTMLGQSKDAIYAKLMEQIDLKTASRLPEQELRRQIIEMIGEIVMQSKLAINQLEQQMLARQIVDDMIGLGPLEPLLADEAITDIMVNGPKQIYIERKGKLMLTDIHFRDNDHVMNIAQRIVTAVGRRVDESSPICDARLKDGSRVNVIAPPLSLKGCSISIRKFSKRKSRSISWRRKTISLNHCAPCLKSRAPVG